MKRSSLAAVIVVSFVIWTVAVLHDFAQDKPIVSIEEPHTSELLVTNNTEVSSVIVVTGKVHVVRDDASYKVLEVNVVSDGGRIFKVLQEGEGKQLVRVLKSKIVRVTGEIREGNGHPLLVVHDMAVIGSVKNVGGASSDTKVISAKSPEADIDVGHLTSNISPNVTSSTNVSVSADIKPSINSNDVITPVPVPGISTNQAF